MQPGQAPERLQLPAIAPHRIRISTGGGCSGRSAIRSAALAVQGVDGPAAMLPDMGIAYGIFRSRLCAPEKEWSVFEKTALG
jgi:hypothetical protein